MSTSLKKGISWSFASTSIGAMAQLVYLYTVASLGGPGTVGIYSLLLAFQSIAFTLQDGGLLTYYIHRQYLSKAEQSALYWLAASVGLTAALILLTIAPALAQLYQAPELIVPLCMIAFQILMLALTSQCQAHLMKELRLVKLSKIEIVGKLSGVLTLAGFFFLFDYNKTLLVGVFFAVTVGSVVRGFGLAISSSSILVQAFKTKRDWSVMRSALAYTGYHLGAQVTNQFRTNLDVLILIKLIGAELTGVYSVAKELVLKPSRVIQPVVARVVTPLLAKSQKADSNQADLFLKSLSICAVANLTVFSSLSLLAPWVISSFFDESYGSSAVLVSILCIWGYCRSLGAPSAALAYANGRADIDFFWNLILLPVNATIVVVASYFHITILALLFSFFQVLITLSSYVFFSARLLPDINFIAFVKTWIAGLLVVTISASLSFYFFLE